MNLDYLLRHVSYDLHTFVRVIDETGAVKKTFCQRPGFRDYLLETKETAKELIEILKEVTTQMPLLFSDSSGICYGVCTFGEHFILAGPFFVADKHFINKRIEMQCHDSFWPYTVPECDFHIAGTDLVLIHNIVNDNNLSLDAFFYHNCVDEASEELVHKHFSHMLFENQERGGTHNPYDQEIRELDSIRNGDIEQLKKSIDEDFVGDYGILAKDKLRSVKNLCIVVIGLASRAAIEGGVLPEVAFTLSDSYISKIEELTSEETIMHLARQAEYHYAGMVHDILEQKRFAGHQKKYNPHIMKCKDYIIHHIHEKIYIRTVAKELNLHPNYLSELFLSCEGCSIPDYINREKISRAKNLLIYSDYSFIDIAAYLGFSSQSHFGTHFLRITGYTPGKYRAKYGVKGFL